MLAGDTSPKEASEAPPRHRGWHSRGYLPHRDEAFLIQSVTFRLADSFPVKKLDQWREWIDPETGNIRTSDAQLRARIDAYLDAGHGECWLRRKEIAELVERALLHFDGERYRLLAWVIMPNHVHVIAQIIEGFDLSGIVHSWKSWTAQQANRLLGRSGPFWFREYWDRFIRDDAHRDSAIAYVENNPVKAGLVAEKADWLWGSAARRRNEDKH
ncbi:MAG: transposase [Verrucomicrobiae bacterium]|nr:transposase [Verrucomicrobiae bacterium]